MKSLISLTLICLVSAGARAQGPDDCQDMVKLRDQSGSLALAINKLDTGINLAVTRNADFTSQFMTTLLFENYICRLNQVLVGKGNPSITRETIDAWLDELNDTYAKYDEAVDGKPPGTLKSSFNAARTAVTNNWKAGGSKTLAYQDKLGVNASTEWLAAVPKLDLTTNFSGTAYLKTAVSKGFSGNYESALAKGEQLTGNQAGALQAMRKAVGVYAAGNTPAATMLRDITNGITQSLIQINNNRSTELLKEQMRLDAEAKSRETTLSNASLKIADLEKRLSDVEQKLKAN